MTFNRHNRRPRATQITGVLALLIALGVPGGAASANAAEEAAPSQAPEAAADADSGDTIVVTARRREEDVQSVPISISVFSGNRLEQTNSQTLDQIKLLAPSLQIFSINPRNVNINIRNLGATGSATGDNLDPGVGVYIDDVYYARPGQSVFDLVDIERVEILKGPQGTLFGRNTTAGAISITTRAPSFTPEATAEVSWGNYHYVQARGAVSLPIGDKIAVRLTASTTYRNGFIHNVRTGVDMQNLNSQALRGQILFKPSESFSLRVIGDYSIRKEDCCVSLLDGAVTTTPTGAVIASSAAERFARIGYTPASLHAFDRITDADASAAYKVKQSGVSGTAKWQNDSFGLTSITAYRTWKWQPTNDSDSTALSVLKRNQSTQEQKQFSQELRIASEGERKIDYVAGLYYFYQTLPQAQITEYGPDAAAFQLPFTVPAAIGNAALNGFTTNGFSMAKTWSYAAFGQTDWHITPRLTLTTGLRFTHEHKKGSYQVLQVAGPDLSTLAPAAAATAQALRDSFGRALFYADSIKANNLSGQVSLAYQARDNILAYATYARGAKSGGVNIGSIPVGVNPAVGPEKVNHFEVGLKTSPLRGVTLNGALFWTEINGLQATFSQSSPPLSYLTNAAKVRSRGAELDFKANPVRWASFYAAATYAKAIYVSYKNAPCPLGTTGLAGVCDLSGESLPNAPKWALSAGGELSQPVGTLEAYTGIDWSYRSSLNSATNNSPFGVVPGYSIVNGRIGIRADDSKWDLYVFARNLFNKDYFINRVLGTNGLITAKVGDPRTFGVTGRFKF